MAVLEISGISKSFTTHLSLGRTRVLNGVDLTVEAGEVFGLLGANGAGKTTTLKTAVGLLRPEQGSVRMFGMPITDVRARARLGFLPEQPYFYDYLTGREFLDFYARLCGIAPSGRAARVAEMLARVGLEDHADRPLRKFSKGMVQRVGLAQALINEPDLIILDEPMSGLDPIGRREFRDIILELRRNGKAVLFSSHILADAEALCDRVAILRGGKVAACGRLDSMLSDRVRFWEATLSRVDPASLNVPHEKIWQRGEQVVVRLQEEEQVDTLIEEVRRLGGTLRSLVPHRRTLEDLFLGEVGYEAPEETKAPAAEKPPIPKSRG